jgi:hypothetical protein
MRAGCSTAEFLVKRFCGLIAVQGHFERLDGRPFSRPPAASGRRVGLVQLADLLLDSEGQALDWFYGLFPSCATQQRAERTRSAVTEPVKDRKGAAESPQSARQWRHLYLLQRDAAVADRGGYAALRVAVQRVAAREAGLTRPERHG